MSVEDCLSRLYETFGSYRIESSRETGCFDYGPDDDEQIGISKPLREIPDAVVGGMEFYDRTWNTWGSESEVKYFLPRVCEYVADDVERLTSPGLCSLFNHKLRNALRPESSKLTELEKQALRSFLEALLSRELSTSERPGSVIEISIAVGISPEDVLSRWRSGGDLRERQVDAVVDHLESFPFLDDPEIIGDFLTALADSRDARP